MCPFCIANVGLFVAGTVSTGGLATLAIKVFRKKNHAESIPNGKERSDEDGNTQRTERTQQDGSMVASSRRVRTEGGMRIGWARCTSKHTG
jgi:hypothetical protein